MSGSIDVDTSPGSPLAQEVTKTWGDPEAVALTAIRMVDDQKTKLADSGHFGPEEQATFESAVRKAAQETAKASPGDFLFKFMYIALDLMSGPDTCPIN